VLTTTLVSTTTSTCIQDVERPAHHLLHVGSHRPHDAYTSASIVCDAEAQAFIDLGIGLDEAKTAEFFLLEVQFCAYAEHEVVEERAPEEEESATGP
jgi:hypothetical protein